MDAKYFLLLSLNTVDFDTPMLKLFSFDSYSELWQHLQDCLFLGDVRWYQIYWGDTLMMQKLIR